MPNKLFITTLLILQWLNFNLIFAQDLKVDLNQLSADSVSLERAVRQLKSQELKAKVQELLNQVVVQKKRYNRYPVDFYYSKKQKGSYDTVSESFLTLDQVVDSIGPAVDLSYIMRINKIDFFRFMMVDTLSKNGNSSLFSTSQDNNFVVLDSFPKYRDGDFLKQILLETLYSADKKRSLEFIWGRSVDNDAYFSTRVTAFDGRFSIYPKYRTYLGTDSFRGKNGWLEKLAVVKNPKYLDTLTLSLKESKTIIPPQIQEQNQVISTQIVQEQPQEKAKVEVVNSSNPISSVLLQNSFFDLNLYLPKNDGDGHELTSEKRLSGNLIYPEIKNIISNAHFVKIDKNQLDLTSKFGGEIVAIKANESSERYFSLFLESASQNPNQRHSLELIDNRSQDASSYFATVITVFDGQLTIFSNYKKITPSEYKKDKKGWLYSLPVQL